MYVSMQCNQCIGFVKMNISTYSINHSPISLKSGKGGGGESPLSGVYTFATISKDTLVCTALHAVF